MLAAALAADEPRFGFTVTRKLGGAVVRNRIRRRLKEAIRTLDPALKSPGHDYVVVARAGTLEPSFANLQDALAEALRKLQRRPSGTEQGPKRDRSPAPSQSDRPGSTRNRR